MKRILTIIISAYILLGVNLSAIAKDNDINVFKLKNGHTVIIKESHINPIVTIDTWVRTGSANEDSKNNGVAHFLEHLFFKGTNNHKAGEFEKILEQKGANYNAATSKDFTHFYITVAEPFFDTALDLHSDMLLNPAIPGDELTKERKVVQEEIRRAKDDNDTTVFNNLITMLFTKHPYRQTILGPEQIIGNISRDEIFNFYHKWYTPSNMITIVVGDVDAQEALSKVQSNFQDNGSGKAASVKHPVEPPKTKVQEKIVKEDLNSGYMILGFKGVDVKNTKESYALDLASTILGDGMSSRLYREVKEKQNLVSSVDAGHYSLKDDSIFYVSANFKPQNYNAVKKSLLDQIARLRTQEVTPQELERAKNMLERSFIYSNESIENIANAVGYNMVLTNDISYYNNYIDDIKKVTAQDILKVSQKYMNENQFAISAMLPEQMPVSEISQKESYKNVTKTVLANGTTLISEKNTTNDIISMSIFLKGGKFVESKAGVSNIIASTLLKGTKNRTAVELANEMENSGIIISPSANSDYFEIAVKSTREDFDKAFSLLKDIFNNPLFDGEDVDKVKSNMFEGIKQSRDDNFSYALEKFKLAMFPNHPYGKVGAVLEKSVPTISVQDLKKYHSDYFIPQNMIVSVNGNIDESTLQRLFEDFFIQRQGVAVDVDKLRTKFNSLAKNNFQITEKNSETGWMALGWPVNGIMEAKDYASLEIINNVLGGGMSSRLFRDLREKQGLAYQVGSGYPSSMDDTFFMMYIGTKPENLTEVKKQFLEGIDSFKTKPLTAKELEEAKGSLIGSYALSHETNMEKAHYLGWYEVVGKGYKFDYNYPQLIESINVDDIIKVANKYFNNPFVVSVIGPKKDVQELEKEAQFESKR